MPMSTYTDVLNEQLSQNNAYSVALHVAEYIWNNTQSADKIDGVLETVRVLLQSRPARIDCGTK